jgi:ribose transport system substrate-binding protein
MQMTMPPGVQIISLRGRWTEESAQHAVASWFRLNTANKTLIHMIAAQNDVMAMGAKKAFQEIANIAEREKWTRLPYIGVDGLPKTGQAWVRIGSLTATIIVPTNAGQAMSMLVEALQTGNNPPERSFTLPESLPPLEKLSPKTDKAGPIVPVAPTA